MKKEEVLSLCIYCKTSLPHRVLRRVIDDDLSGWQLECIDCYSRTPMNYNEILIAKLLKDKDARFDPKDTLWSKF